MINHDKISVQRTFRLQGELFYANRAEHGPFIPIASYSAPEVHLQ